MTNQTSRATRPTREPAAAAASELQHVDLEAFLADLRRLRAEIDDTLGERDLAHLRRLQRIGHLATLLGLATAWIAPNPLSMAALSFGRSVGWLLMHHVGHRGYDRVPGVPRRLTGKGFARGRRRFLDWPDWMLPEAWIYEHNVLHHSHVGEERDPDLIERNAAALRGAALPRALKLALMGLLALTWKPVYYAPNTLRAWRSRFERPADGGRASGGPGYLRDLWARCLLPYSALQFGALPALFLPLGGWAALSALINSLGAEALTNLHTFLVVGPNHTGDDLWRFSEPPSSTGEWSLRQVVGSTNYACGDERTDLLHLYLNYQIEHHLWPDLPMLRYREVQPKVKALCARHGIPYVQQGVFARLRKMLAVAVGATSMRSAATVGTADPERGETRRAGSGFSAAMPAALANPPR